ncbi:asparagine synthase C-terminal domain-containing protein, partial [Pseudothermotoga sp.]|uniref:asparagine synthetase B family protein n=1 Tax=Pseudothermotoga sp. TaxID=2033661 RepID=UPI0031F679D3
FFKEIKELQPGNSILLSLDNFELKIDRFRTLVINKNYEKYSEEKAKIYSMQVRELLFKAVRRRLRSDVPVGSCLSGGLDSSTIVMIVNKLLKHERIDQIGERQKVFTAVFNGYPIDESKWARIVVEHGNIEWHVTNPTFEELIRDIEDLIYYQDFPFPSTSIYASYRVMKLVAEKGVKVSLDGQGADELFTGYYPYYSYFFKELVKNGSLMTLISEVCHYKNSPLNTKQFLLRLFQGLSPNWISLPLSTMIRSQNFLFRKDFYNYYSHRIREYVKKSLSVESLNEALANFFGDETLKSLLRYADRNSMRFSIEARVPYSDDTELVDFVFKIPSTYKIHKGYSKYILRRAVEGLVPDEIRWRRDKIGFQTPESKWFLDKKNDVAKILHEHERFINQYLDMSTLFKLLDSKDSDIFSRYIWKLINLGVWLSMDQQVKIARSTKR